MGVNINNAQICSLPCAGSLSTQTQGEDPDVLSSITTLCFGRLLPWWLYFINICWRRRIPNLSRALFQISLSGLNEDWSRCRCYRGVFFFFLPPFFLSQWIKKKKKIECPTCVKRHRSHLVQLVRETSKRRGSPARHK